MRSRLLPVPAFLVLLTAAACSRRPAVSPADLVLTNGRIVTVEDAQPSAAALAVQGDRIAAVGSVDEIKPYIGSNTQVIDLQGQLALPGFIESHGHFTGVGETALQLNLMKTQTWDEIVAQGSGLVSRSETL